MTHSAAARGFDADTLARAAVIFSLNAHGVSHPHDASKEVSALFEVSSKFSHSCDPNSEYSLDEEGQDEPELTHTTLREVAPGEVLTVSYMPLSRWSTTVRRHLLARGKFFSCNCALCTAPDRLAALPCPACVRRGADGTVPYKSLFISPEDAADWQNPTFAPLREEIPPSSRTAALSRSGGAAKPAAACSRMRSWPASQSQTAFGGRCHAATCSAHASELQTFWTWRAGPRLSHTCSSRCTTKS